MHGNNSFFTVVSNECDNSENTQGEHTGEAMQRSDRWYAPFICRLFSVTPGDGVLNVFASGEHDAAMSAYGGIFPLLNWHALNGITVEADIPIEPCRWAF